MSENKKISDVKITQIMGLPRNTLQEWKKKDISDWRYKVYNYIKSKNEEELKSFISELETDFK